MFFPPIYISIQSCNELTGQRGPLQETVTLESSYKGQGLNLYQ